MSYTNSFYHIVFRTKNSQRTIDLAHDSELHNLIWDFCTGRKVFVHKVNGMEDHLHLAVNLPPDYALSVFVRELKTYTTSCLKSNPHFRSFSGWSEGYFATTYSHDDIPKIVNYIEKQKEHHSSVPFLDEIRTLITRSGQDLREEYFKRNWLY